MSNEVLFNALSECKTGNELLEVIDLIIDEQVDTEDWLIGGAVVDTLPH